MLNSKVFRLFWRDNLRSSRRRSASCPNLENLSQESETQGQKSYNNNAFVSASESESDDDATKKFVERLRVQQSIRRVHRREKEKKENAEKKLISMDDYLGKLSELKTWLKEEQKKDVDNIKSPKLKAHFKTFMKLWNKRKLPLKYYKSCSVDLDNDDAALSPSYSQQSVNYQGSPFKEAAELSTSILHTPFNLPQEENSNNVGTPFSTFGKCDLHSSPIVFTEQDSNATKCIRKKEGCIQESSPRKHNKYNGDQSSQNGSPPKFATISRAVPAASLFYKFTAQPWSSGENIKARPVLAPKCPDAQNHLPASPVVSSPALTRICSYNITEGEQGNNADVVHQGSLPTKSTGPSPVYSTTVDAIPYNTGSPKYAEIDESICHTPQKFPASGYCSISPLQKWKPAHADVKQSVSKKQSFSRRRSKSMEDIYSLPFKGASLVKVADFTNKEYTESLETPPIPDRKYSPDAVPSACPQQTNRKTAVQKSFEDYSQCYTSPSKVSLASVSGPPDGRIHKRQSPEARESVPDSASSLKKAKVTVSSNLDLSTDFSETSVLNSSELDSASTPVLSILTGSLNPTTRSKYKMDASVKLSETNTNIASNSTSSEARLSMIKIQQLDESPKLPRRRLKRRSSSFSTTPGKGLTFGKASKMSAASPRRVSFAKNVKEAENKTTPGKSSPARYSPAKILTTQTQDRRKFESFLSSHENLLKGKASSPEKISPPKITSPGKRSSPQKSFDNTNTLMSRVYSEKLENKIKKDLFPSRNDERHEAQYKLSTSSLADDGKNGTLSSSSTRQVGRRVLGAPKASPDKMSASPVNTVESNVGLNTGTGSLTNTVRGGPSLSLSTRQVGRRVGAHKASPDKNSAVSKNTDYLKSSTEFVADTVIQGTPHLSSSTRHAGERVCAPKESPDKNSAASKSTDYLKSSTEFVADTVNQGTPHSSSPRKQAERRVLSLPRISPEKNVNPEAQTLPTRKVLNQAHLSPKTCSPPAYSPPKHLEVSSSPRKVSPHSSEKTSKISLQLCTSHSSLSEKNVERSLPSHVTDTTLRRSSLLKHTSPQDRLGSPQKTLSQPKDAASPLKHHPATKRFDLPSVSASKKSITALVSKLTEKTSTICAKELSESDDCLSSDEVFCPPTSHLNGPESPDIIPNAMKMSPVLSSPSNELPKEIEDFIITTLESSPGNKDVETLDFTTNPSVTSSNHSLSNLGPAPNLEHVLETAGIENPPVMSGTTNKHSLQSSEDESHTFPAQAFCGFSDNEKIDTESDKTDRIPQLDNSYGYRRVTEAVVSHCLTLPVNYMTLDHKTTCSPKVYHCEDKEVPCHTEDSYLSDLTSGGNTKECEKNYAFIQTEKTEVDQINHTLQVNNASDSLSKSASDDSVADDDKNNEYQCDLKRLASIKPSPKVVENDSWVTERRTSSRGKHQYSFRSAYNKHLLRTSSKECDEAEVNRSATESLSLTPDFLDSGTVAGESPGIIENAQGTLLTNAAEFVNKEMTPNRPENCPYLDLVSSATENRTTSSPAKVKPATLPKPSKVSLLARRNINTASKSTLNPGKTSKRRSSIIKSEVISTTTTSKRLSSVKSEAISTTTTSKRRSSIIKSEAISTTPSRLEKSRIKHDNSRTRLSAKLDTPRERLSIGQSKVSKRVSSGKNKVGARTSNVQSKYRESKVQMVSEEESSVIVEDDGQKHKKIVQKVASSEEACSKPQANSTRKVSSAGAAGRRRSKNRSIGEENKVSSFAEKMKFFNQLRVNDVKTQTNRALNSSCQVRGSPRKPNQAVEESVGAPNKNSELASFRKTRGIFPDKHSTDIM